jgi:hypothetical protein
MTKKTNEFSLLFFANKQITNPSPIYTKQKQQQIYFKERRVLK